MGSQGSGKKRDVVFVYSKARQKGSYKVLRAREDRVELGELRQPSDGEKLDGDLVKLTPREEHQQLFDVETVASRQELTAAHDGPAQVATESYRKGWDEIFGEKKPARAKQKAARYLN